MLDGREWLDLLTTVKEFPSLVGLDKIAANYPSVASTCEVEMLLC